MITGPSRKHFANAFGLLAARRAFAAAALSLVLALCAIPAMAFQASELSETDKKELKKAWAPSLSKKKGPFGPNTCVCTDGRSGPVLRPDGSISNICGAESKTVFCGAVKAPWGDALEKHGVYVANIFSRDMYDWDQIPDHHDLIRGYILEKFFIETHPTHKLAQMRQYGGISGAEYETEAQPRLFERYLALKDFSDFRHFILAYELQKRYFARGDFGKMQEVRAMASRIQGRDPNFKPLRDAVHSQVSASLIPMLSTYRDKAPKGQTRTMVDELITEIKKLTSMTADDLQPQIAKIEDTGLRGELKSLADAASGNAVDNIAALAKMMVLARQKVAARDVSPADARRLIDLNIMAGSVIQSRGSALLDSGDLKTVEQHVRLMLALTDASYGVGLLAARERTAASDNLSAILANPEIDRVELLRRLENAQHIVEWAQNGAMLAFSEVWAPWIFLMPDVAHIGDDILRGSPLLLFAQVDQRLTDFVSGQGAVKHQIFDTTLDRGVRALNPGLAMGKLRVNPKVGTYSRQEVLALASTPADLQPTSGIITQGEGNVVSHVQLLARALGIPNAVSASEPYEKIVPHDGEEVFYVVTPGGKVILKDVASMTDQEKAVYQEFTKNMKRTDDGSLASGGGGGKLHIDVDRLDLSANMPVDMATLRRKDSGIRSGPKAAFLGELKYMFPDNVARGVVVPFGVYYDHLQSAKVAVPPKLDGKGIAKPGELLTAFLEATYGKFFGEMIAGGTSERELSAWIKPRLAVIRHSIQQHPLTPKVRDTIRDELDGLELLDPDDKTQSVGVFVRSDTNVEDLENFNGAGLNLTIFNLKSLDDIYAGLKEVWASPFTYRSFSWRQTLIDKPMWVLPSVVILESISSEKSGVAVTADIDHGDPDKILMATSEGVGGAVDGTPAETILWSKDGVELITMFKSPHRRLLKPGGGSEVVPSTGSEYVLSDREVEQLAAAAQKIEQTLEPAVDASGTPRPWDIEYGFKDGKLWLFQSRPFIGSEEIANLPALASLDEPAGDLTGTVSLKEIVK